MYRAAVLSAQQALRRMPAPSLAALRYSLHEFKARPQALQDLLSELPLAMRNKSTD